MMERKLKKGTSAKLNNLKELFLNSTLRLSQSTQSSGETSKSREIENSRNDNVVQKNRTKNSISLFNLMDSEPSDSENCTRPLSMTFNETNSSNYDFRNSTSKSVSMYGLVEKTERHSNAQNNHHNLSHNGPSSKNVAARLFYTIRSKFRERRRDRGKIVDSKSTDFGTFLSDKDSNECQTSASARYKLKSSQSAENVIDNFTSPIGYRNECDNDRVFSPIPSTSTNINVTNDGEQEGLDNTRVNDEEEISKEIVPAIPPKTKCLTIELRNLVLYGWYWGGISKDDAEEKLRGQPDGAFCVRDSSSSCYLLTLSFNSNGRTLHTRIEYRNGEFRFSEADSFPTVAELIEHCIANSEDGVFCYSKARRSNQDHPSYPVRLTTPISRFSQVKSLLYYSRVVIRKQCRLDLISMLPLPPSLIEYVGERTYLC